MSAKTAWCHRLVAECGGIVGNAQLMRRWGITQQAVYARSLKADFPATLPGEVGRNTAVWLLADIIEWEERNGITVVAG